MRRARWCAHFLFIRIAAGIRDSLQNWQHDISLNSIILATACKHFKGNIIMDNKTPFHEWKTARSRRGRLPHFAKIHFTLLGISSRNDFSEHSSFRSRCYKVRRSHTQNDSIIARHQLCSSGPLLAATAHAFITYSIWPAKLFLYIRRVFPLVGWPVGALTFYAPHEIYLVINQNSSSGGVRFLCDVVVV
jgi:hypothetical protein